MHAATRRQREVLDVISRYVESNGYRPSYQTIARKLQLRSKGGIARIVADLEEQGFLSRQHNEGHFSLVLRTQQADAPSGQTIEWLETPHEEEEEAWDREPFSLPEFMLNGRSAEQMCAFRVPDDEMSYDNICRDDIVLVEKKEFPRDGDRVVVRVDDDTFMLRRIYRIHGDLELRTADDADEANNIRLDSGRVKILGIYRGLLRCAG